MYRYDQNKTVLLKFNDLRIQDDVRMLCQLLPSMVTLKHRYRQHGLCTIVFLYYISQVYVNDVSKKQVAVQKNLAFTFSGMLWLFP